MKYLFKSQLQEFRGKDLEILKIEYERLVFKNTFQLKVD